jgi:hypothetical protein
MPARVLDRYISDPKSRESWASAEDIVAAMYRIVTRGEKIPLRVPLSPDSWGMMKAEFGRMEAELEGIKELSFAVGRQDQLESIEFLKSQK